ncbi:MAG: hypothetical protein C0459_09715 [Chitinophaga sp.]|jgi:hypothetical protein|nr:hypothetical protein [Chitinophaga sp.]
MMAKLFFILFFIAVPRFIFSQISNQYLYHDTRENPAYGSAKKLLGSTYIINCFVSADRKGWNMADKNYVLRLQNEGLGWIQWHANKWGISGLSFDTYNIGFDTDIKLNEIERTEDFTKMKTQWVTTVLHAAGYNNIPAFYDSVKAATKADNIVVMVFAKRESRSHAQASGTNNVNNERFLEGSVVFSQAYNGYPVTAGVILHEMLHLFGAKDIYEDKQVYRDPEALEKMKSVFPNSIMLETYTDIAHKQMEQFTAWCIGWTNSYYGWYDLFMHNTVIK